MRAEMLQAKQAPIDAQWWRKLACLVLFSLLQLASIFLLLHDTLQQVLCIANFKGELVLESFNKRAKQLCVGLLEGKDALK